MTKVVVNCFMDLYLTLKKSQLDTIQKKLWIFGYPVVRIGHREYVLLDFVCKYDRPIYVCLSRAEK